MLKKKKISREEKASNSYNPSLKDVKKLTEKTVPKDPDREEILRKVTEKQVKEIQPEKPKKSVEKKETRTPYSDLESIEYSTKKRVRKKKKIRKVKKTTIKIEKFSPPKIILKKGGYELIITEKPQAAMKIATALGNSTKRDIRGVPYYEVDRNGKKIIVACAVGHLFTLKQNIKGSHVPIFDISWVPNYMAKKGDFTKKYYDALVKLAKNAGSITVATDFDVEGEVIGANIVKFICNQKDAERMKFSTLTTKELNNAYEKKQKHLEWEQALAGEARHFLDWFYGINLSRALMNAIKTTGKFKILSIGRVQGPALKLIVDKEKEIKKFKPEPFWQVFITLDNPEIQLKYVKDIFDKNELKKFEDIKGKKIQTKTEKSEQKVYPNPPFNLTALQTEAYKLYGLSPSKTLQIAQSLYLAGLISYPRTSSQKLPSSIKYKSILEILKIRYKVSKLITKDKPLEGSKTDPAHPSIYPTGNKQVLSGDDEKIYELIVKRFLALFCDPALIDKKKVTGELEGLKFTANGSQIKKKSWMSFYPTKTKESNLQDSNGEKIIKNSEIQEKETQPPKRYSQASILSELEKRNLGTKATRAAILETLYDRGYIKERSIETTPLGLSLIETLEKDSPIIINEKLTKKLQDEMDEILEKKGEAIKKLELKRNEIINKAKENIIEIAEDFEKKQESIGKHLIEAEERKREIEKKENTLNTCPKCKTSKLRITYSPKTKRQFVACSGYPNCKNTYSLPPESIIKQTGKNCEKCGFPMLMSLKKGRKPWFFCFNTECETNKKRLEEYRKKQENKNN